MHVEIDDGDALQAVRIERVLGGDGDVVENAKAHRRLRLGVMARRTHGAERHVIIARKHRIDGRDAGAGGAVRSFA